MYARIRGRVKGQRQWAEGAVKLRRRTSQKMVSLSSGRRPLLLSSRKSRRVNFLKPQSFPGMKRYAFWLSAQPQPKPHCTRPQSHVLQHLNFHFSIDVHRSRLHYSELIYKYLTWHDMTWHVSLMHSNCTLGKQSHEHEEHFVAFHYISIGENLIGNRTSVKPKARESQRIVQISSDSSLSPIAE